MDLTAVATPGYFGSMGLENWLLKRRAERIGPSAADYERGDTLANLAMGTASLLIPMATYPLAEHIAPQRSKVGKGLIALAAGAAVATTVADRVIRTRAERRARFGTSAAASEITTGPMASTNGDGPATNGDAHVEAPDPTLERARLVARYGGPTAIAAGGLALTTGAMAATRPKKLWASPRRTRDLGEGVLAAVAAIAAWDFIYYWNHRLMHTSRVLWAHHVAHHSSERFNLSTALRQPVADVLGVYVPYGVLCFAGIRPSMIEQARGLNLLYQFWIHTDLVPKLGKAEEVLNTASHHRVHHGSNRRYIDRNHGSILIVWDRLFGSFAREDEAEPVVYGLTKNIETDNPVTIASHEFRDILRDVSGSDNWPDRFSFVLRGPGWAYARHAELAADPVHDDLPPVTAGVA
ncbi:MAG TPA: sterol desaturase family protein [Acidimicrobiales bacterium]